MPTFSQESVRALPMETRTAMSLEEMRDEMVRRPPRLDGFQSGWASTENRGSNLRQAGVEPPLSTPQVEEATDKRPRMLKARFYYWDAVPSGLRSQPDHDPLASRLLNAIDVIVTQPNSTTFGLLFSTRTRAYLGGPDGAIASLNRILQTKDGTIKIDRAHSHLGLYDEEIFLWLAVQHRDNPQISGDLRVDEISGISSRDVTSRTADLRYGVDFDRSNFLTAVAEKDTLGPIDVCFSHSIGHENHSYEVRVHVDGGFEFRKNGLYFPDELNRENLMLEASLDLAYYFLPRINKIYVSDLPQWNAQRATVIRDAMTALEERYRSLRGILEAQLEED